MNEHHAWPGETPMPAVPTRCVLGRFRLAGTPLRGAEGALAAQWRGAVAALFHDDVAFHGHDGARTIARYPEVQYRWVEGAPCLFAFGAAAERAMAYPWPGTSLTLDRALHTITEVSWQAFPWVRGFSRRLMR